MRQAVPLLFRLSPEQAAARLGIPVDRLRRWMASPDFQQAVEDYSLELREALKRIGEMCRLGAARVILEAMLPGDPSLAKTAVDVLKLGQALGGEAGSEFDPGGELLKIVSRAMAESGTAEAPEQ